MCRIICAAFVFTSINPSEPSKKKIQDLHSEWYTFGETTTSARWGAAFAGCCCKTCQTVLYTFFFYRLVNYTTKQVDKFLKNLKKHIARIRTLHCSQIKYRRRGTPRPRFCPFYFTFFRPSEIMFIAL